jgi:hypothetical protein
MGLDIINITATDGRIDINSIDPFAESRIVVDNNNPTDVIKVSEPERIVVDGQDIITGNIQIIAENQIEVIRVVERGQQGSKGDKGEKGDVGLSGAGKPFYEILEGELYQSTASVSIFSNFMVTGSAYITQDLITYGNIGINTANPSSLFSVVSDDGAQDLVTIQSQSVDYFKINNQGVAVFGEFGFTPDPITGGMYYDATGFYVGI